MTVPKDEKYRLNPPPVLSTLTEAFREEEGVPTSFTHGWNEGGHGRYTQTKRTKQQTIRLVAHNDNNKPPSLHNFLHAHKFSQQGQRTHHIDWHDTRSELVGNEEVEGHVEEGTGDNDAKGRGQANGNKGTDGKQGGADTRGIQHWMDAKWRQEKCSAPSDGRPCTAAEIPSLYVREG